MFKIVKNDKPGICCAYRCSNKRAAGKTLCHKHARRRVKELNPTAYHFDILKQNAKRRGKEFTLTLAEFKAFCSETKYLERKGRSAWSASIDRIDPSKGYEAGNIQLLSLSENAKKKFKDEEVPF